MAKLFEVLYVYAEENLVVHFQRETAAERRTAQRRADKLTKQLNGMAPDAEGRVEALKQAWDAISDCHDRALFLSGLSIGIKLGQL